LPNITLEPKLVESWVRGASPKFLDPLFISATTAVSNFRFGTQLGLASCVPRDNI